MKIGFFIIARLKSTRLKRKLLLTLEGRSVLGHVIERAKRVDGIDEVVVCTSTVAQDHPMLDICQEHCFYFNGSPEDVLNRLLSAATFFDCDYLLLITADNPLFSFEYAQCLVDEIKRDSDVDYLHIDGLPLGMDPYIFRRKAFEVIDAIKMTARQSFGRNTSRINRFSSIDRSEPTLNTAGTIELRWTTTKILSFFSRYIRNAATKHRSLYRKLLNISTRTLLSE